MPNQHKTKMIAWHSADSTLKQWIADQATRRGMTVKAFLDLVLADYRAKQDPDTSKDGQ